MPTSIAAAADALADPSTRLLAGGTTIMAEVNARRSLPTSGPLVSLRGITELRGITGDPASGCRLGALTTYAELVGSPAVPSVLRTAAASVAGPAVRARATIGGAVALGRSDLDVVAALAALGASVERCSPGGARDTVPLAEAVGHSGRLVTAIVLPAAPGPQSYHRAAQRAAMAYPLAAVAAVALGARGGDGVRVGLAGARPAASAVIAADGDLGSALAPLLVDAAIPDTVDAPRSWRQEAFRVLAGRAVTEVQRPAEPPPPVPPSRCLSRRRAAPTRNGAGSDRHAIRLTVDGCSVAVAATWDGASLLDALRASGYLAVKDACEQGVCGSCTIRLDGDLAPACLVLAADADGADVGTSASDDPVVADVRAALVSAGAVQCGFCSPGMVVTIAHHLRQGDGNGGDVGGPADAEAWRRALVGNLCRCTGYGRIVAAARAAATNAHRTSGGGAR